MPTVDAVSAGTAVLSNTTISWSHTCAASANKLVVNVSVGSSAIATINISTVTYNGVSLSLIRENDDGNFEMVSSWYLDNPASGANTVVVTTNFTVQQLMAGASSWIGALAGAPANSYTATGNTANPSVTVVDSASGDAVIGAYASDVGPTATTTNNGTTIYDAEDVSSDSDFAAQYYTASGANHVASWTCSASGAGNDWAIHAFAIKSAPGAGGGGRQHPKTIYVMP